MTHADLTRAVREGLSALDTEDTSTALAHFEIAASVRPSAVVLSCLGYCLARERGETGRGLSLCEEALREEPANPLHYLNLGRIYLLAGQRRLALETFQQGLAFDRFPRIQAELRRMGRRRTPVIPFLGRDNRFNKYSGLFLSCLGLR